MFRGIVDRAGVAAERKERHFLRIVTKKRNAGIVLDNRGAVGEQKIAHGSEMAGMQQIGRALDQAIRGRQSLAELQEAACSSRPVGKIGCEIIQRLFLTIAACEHNPHPPRYVGAGIFVGEVCSPLVVERDQADVADGLSERPGDIQQRQVR